MDVNEHEAKTHLSRLLLHVEQGGDVVIHRAGRPVARLVKVGTTREITYGRDQGRFAVPADFDAPLADQLLDAYERRAD